jgi:hypothetical protein
VGFYGQVMRELMVALGGALLVGNLLALWRRRSDAELAAARTVARTRPGSPVRPNRLRAGDDPLDLPQAPVARSVTYAAIGFVVMVWGIASLASL